MGAITDTTNTLHKLVVTGHEKLGVVRLTEWMRGLPWANA